MLMALTTCIITLAMPGHHKDAHGKQGNILPLPLYYTWIERETIVDKMPCLGTYALGGLEPPTLWLRSKSTLSYTVLPHRLFFKECNHYMIFFNWYAICGNLDDIFWLLEEDEVIRDVVKYSLSSIWRKVLHTCSLSEEKIKSPLF